jgi:hypothetical protein
MRYFFHAIGHSYVSTDPVGEEFADRADAMALATMVARKLAEAGKIAGCISITDEQGNEIGRAPFAPLETPTERIHRS